MSYCKQTAEENAKKNTFNACSESFHIAKEISVL